MNKPLVIIISGESGTGKTTLGKMISKELSIPLFYRDNLKEIIFDTLGISDREWSHKVGIAAYELLYSISESLLLSKNSFIIESTFKPNAVAQRLNKLKQNYPYNTIQIRLEADKDILLKRFVQRVKNDERHPGHVDSTNIEDFRKELMKEEIPILDIGGEIMRIDTSDFNKIDFDLLFKKLHNLMKDT